MNLLTSNRVNITPMFWTETTAPAQVLQKLIASKYDGTVPGQGWGAVALDANEPLIQTRQAPGTPAAPPSGVDVAIIGRLLFDQYMPKIARALPIGMTDAEESLSSHELWGVDVIFLRRPTGYEVLVSTMDPDEIERVQKQLKEDFTVIGDGTDVVISIDSSEYVPDLDLFLWMYSKTGVPGGELAPDLSIDDIKTLTVTDAHDKRVQLYTSVDVDRAEAAVRARDPHSKFGPLRTLLGDGLNRLDVDWQLNLRGSFTIFVGTSRYEDAVGIAVKSRIGRLHAVTHVATSLIPRMYEAHRGDKTWHATGRAALRSQATANLVHTLAGSITCPNCGHVH